MCSKWTEYVSDHSYTTNTASTQYIRDMCPGKRIVIKILEVTYLHADPR